MYRQLQRGGGEGEVQLLLQCPHRQRAHQRKLLHETN